MPCLSTLAGNDVYVCRFSDQVVLYGWKKTAELSWRVPHGLDVFGQNPSDAVEDGTDKGEERHQSVVLSTWLWGSHRWVESTENLSFATLVLEDFIQEFKFL
jgi:hypothetical protein